MAAKARLSPAPTRPPAFALASGNPPPVPRSAPIAWPTPVQNDLTLALQPVEGGDFNCTTIMHTNKMPPNGDNGVTNSGPLNEKPPGGYLLAKEPGAGGAPPDGANLERLVNKTQVNTTEDGVTLDCGRDKVASSLVGSLVIGDSFRASPPDCFITLYHLHVSPV